MSWRSLGAAGSFGSDEDISFIASGARHSDTGHNNSLQLADMMSQARGRRIKFGPWQWSFWDPVVPSTQAGFYATSPIVLPTNTIIIGIPAQTVFRYGLPGSGLDPTDPTKVPHVPTTLAPLLRSTFYGFSAQAYINGESYRNTTIGGGTTSSNPADAPTGVFSGGHSDGTCVWVNSSLPYRGGGFLTFGDGCKDSLVYGITLDGRAPWIDEAGTVRPPGYPAYSIISSSQPSMYAQPISDQLGYVYGYDIYHRAFDNGGKIGGVAFGTNCDRNRIANCVVKNWRGEMLYGDAIYDNGLGDQSPDTTLTIEDTWFDSGSVCVSSSVGIKVRRCRFSHIHQVFDCARGRSDLDIDSSYFYDCQQGVITEQGLRDQKDPGITWVRNCEFRNIYGNAVGLRVSFSSNPIFAGIRAVRVTDNEFFDCAWTSGAALQIQSFGDVPPNVLTACDVLVSGNHFHVGELVAPTRSGGATATQCGAAMQFSNHFDEFRLFNNKMTYDQSAIAAGHTFNLSILWELTNIGSKVWVKGNKFISQNGISLTPPASTTDQYIGLWEDNEDWCAANTVPWVGGQANGGTYAAGATIYPKLPVWVAIGNTINTIVTIAAIGRPERWQLGQRVQLAYGNSGFPLLIPQSSATHKLKAPRLAHNAVILTLRRDTTNPLVDTPVWIEDSYLLASSGMTPTANDVVPPFVAGGINSFAPSIETFGLTEVTLSPAGATNWDGLSDPPIGIIRVHHNGANNTFRHNAGALTIKLFLHGAANYTPAAAGIIEFEYDGVQATEYRRREGASAWA